MGCDITYLFDRATSRLAASLDDAIRASGVPARVTTTGRRIQIRAGDHELRGRELGTIGRAPAPIVQPALRQILPGKWP